MATLKKPTFFSLIPIFGLILGLIWLRAQETPSNSNSDIIPSDKWTQIQENNKKMSQTLTQIESNLNFIKARSMSGGPKKN